MLDIVKATKLEKDLEALRFVLESEDDGIKLPDNIRSENLMHLLPEEPDRKKINFLSILTSKRAIPFYSCAAAAVIIMAVLPKLSLNKTDMFMTEEAAMAPVMSVEASENAVYDEVYDEEQAVEEKETMEEPTDAGGVDLTVYTQEEQSSTVGPATGSAKIPEPHTDPPAEDAEDKASYAMEGGGSAPTNVNATASGGTAAFSAKATAIALDSKWNNHTMSWRPMKPEEAGYTKAGEIVFEVTDKDGTVYVAKPLKDAEAVMTSAVHDNKVYLLVVTKDGLLLNSYGGIEKGQLDIVNSNAVKGAYVGAVPATEFAYIASGYSDEAIVGEKITIENSREKGKLLMTAVNLNDGSLTQVTIMGTDYQTISLLNSTLEITYKDDKDVVHKKVFKLEGASVKSE